MWYNKPINHNLDIITLLGEKSYSMDENKLFLKIIEERYERFRDYYAPMNSDFLSMEQQSMLAGFLRTHRGEGVFLFGGYHEAERKQVLFMPDYTGVSDELSAWNYYLENPQECPMELLDIRIADAEKSRLSHRDYLGALMGEGIKREKIGDIIVGDKGAQIVVAREMADYLAQNFTQAGRVSFTAKTSQISELKQLETCTKNEKFTISSPRIDNIVSAVFGISRKDAQDAVSRGKVFIDGVETTKPDFFLKGGEKVVLRGRGKAVYVGEKGTTRKGKVVIETRLYI